MIGIVSRCRSPICAECSFRAVRLLFLARAIFHSRSVPAAETPPQPLPAEIQNYTTYAAGPAPDSKQFDAALKLIALLGGPSADSVLKARGMERPPS